MDSKCARPARSLPAAIVLTLTLAACTGAKTPNSAPQAPQVSVVTVHRGSVPVTTELPGRTSAYLVAQVRARVDGMGIERRKLVQQLSGVVKDAQALLSELGHEAAEQVGRLAKATRRRGKRKSVRIPKGTAGGPDAKKHRLPATTRQKMTKRRGA